MAKISLNPKYLALFIAGLLVGLALLVTVRAIALSFRQTTHYHANFAVYIEGQRQQFNDPTFYEEVTACSDSDELTPQQRVHMHQPDNDVVHVHDTAVTWGHFLSNIGFTAGSDFMSTRDDLFMNNETLEVHYVLNGREVPSIGQREIKSEDKLLISYGTQRLDELQKQFESIESSAGEMNHNPDPASCGGSQNESFIDRLKQSII